MIRDCKVNGIDLRVVETRRSPARQAQMVRLGKSRLGPWRSKHQYNAAVDVVPIINGRPAWHNRKLWHTIGIIGESRGLRWGGRWRGLYDPGHFESMSTIDELRALPTPDTTLILLNF